MISVPKLLTWIAFIITVVAIVVGVIIHYQLWLDLDSVIDRAQVSADAADMHAYMGQLQTNMEARGVTTGSTAVIFRGPSNDMALHYKAVVRINERLALVEKMPKSETAYQVALDDIRGTIRELPNPADGLAWVRYWVFVVWGGIILWIVVGLVWASTGGF